MALKNCPECKKQISDQAQSCPHCGFPLKSKIFEWNIENDRKEEKEKREFLETLSESKSQNINKAKKRKKELLERKRNNNWGCFIAFLIISIIVIIAALNTCDESTNTSKNNYTSKSHTSKSDDHLSDIKTKYAIVSLNVRKKPNTKSKVLKTLKPNEKVKTKGIVENEFTQILNSNNQILGWCATKYLQNRPVVKSETAKQKKPPKQQLTEEITPEKQTQQQVSKLSKSNDKFVKLTKDTVLIKCELSSMSYNMYGMKNDVFELAKIENEWYVIFMFSGEYRYVLKSSAIIVESIPPYSFSNEIKKKVFKEAYHIEGTTEDLAMRKYPNDIYKEIDYTRYLDDRYKLELFRKYSIPVPYSSKVNIEGIKKNWHKSLY